MFIALLSNLLAGGECMLLMVALFWILYLKNNPHRPLHDNVLQG